MDKEVYDVKLVDFNDKTLAEIWALGFREENPEWKQWDGPYFDDYTKYDSVEEFFNSSEYSFFINENRQCILVDGKPIGMVSMYWKDKKTLWLEIGITIYDTTYRNKGIGTRALKIWINKIFSRFSELEHIGLTTWSGNYRMLKAAEKLKMTKESQVRRVRFWNGKYYDSISYGMLREEFIPD